jgi:hypothetical protein
MRFILLVVAVAVGMGGCGGCNDDGRVGSLPDAPPPPDGQDAPDGGDPPKTVTLSATLDGAPVAGVLVYFQNADNSLVASMMTGVTGTASAAMAAGGYVTAIDPFVSQAPTVHGGIAVTEIRTFAGVKPGDQLVLERRSPVSISFTLWTSEVVGATNYDVFTSCGNGELAAGTGSGGGPSGQVVLNDCNGTADIAVLASILNGDTKVPVSALYHPGVALTANATVDLTADVYGQLNQTTVTYLNNPFAATASVDHTVIAAHGRFGPFTARKVGDSVMIGEPMVPATGEIFDTSIVFTGRHHVIDWGGPTAAYTLDMTNVFLPGIVFDPLPSFDVVGQRVSWMEEPGRATPDASVAAISVTRSTGGITRFWHWRLAGPYTAGALTFPTLPTTLFDWAPADGDTIDLDELMTARIAPGGYDAVRGRVLAIREAGDAGSFVVGPTGRVVTVELFVPPSPGRPQR